MKTLHQTGGRVRYSLGSMGWMHRVALNSCRAPNQRFLAVWPGQVTSPR